MADDITKTDEFKDALAEAVKAATDGLKTKNDELNAKLKKRTTDFDEMKTQLETLQSTVDEAEAAKAEKTGDQEARIKQLNDKHAREVEKLRKENDTTAGRLKKLVIDEGLRAELVKAEVAPQYLDATMALIQNTHTIEAVDVDGVPSAQVNGTPLTEFIPEWAKGDQGQHFVKAPDSSGGGAEGANGSRKAAPAKSLKDMTPDDKTAYIAEHGLEAWNKRVADETPHTLT